MGFLSSWFLGGLAALALPVYLHLLRQHRSEPLPFSSLMFFESRTQSSVKHRRLRHYLLLALRLLLLLLLVLAFADPFLRRPPGAVAAGSKMLVLAIDNSFSMGESGHLDAARRAALGAVANLRGGDRGLVLTLGGGIQILNQPTTDPEELRAAVQSVPPSAGRSAFADLARALTSIAQSSRMPVEAHLFSDMQKSSLARSFQDLRLPPDARLVLHASASAARDNWAVEHVNAPRRIYDPRKARVQVTIVGFHTSPATRQVTLVLNGKTLATQTVNLLANGRATVEFLGVDAPYGLNRGEVRIEPADRLPGDDRFRFATERGDPKRILFVSDPRQPRALLYYRSALEAAADSAFAVDAVGNDQLAGTALSADRYALVVLSDIGALAESFESSLAQFVRGGGSLLICLGGAAATRARVPVIDEAIVDSVYASRSGERFHAVAWADTAHPSIRKAERWQGVKFYRTIRVNPGQSRVLARLADQTPVLLEKQVGEGRVLVFASTLDNIANDFPLHASFVPFIEQTARYLSRLEEGASSVLVDSFAELKSDRDASRTVEVLDPDGKRALSLSEAATAQSVKLSKEGFYEIVRASGRHELIAVNADRRESDLDVIPSQTLALWQNTGQGAANTAAAGEPQEGRPLRLGWYVLVAAAVFALAESVVASRYLSASAMDGLPARSEGA